MRETYAAFSVQPVQLFSPFSRQLKSVFKRLSASAYAASGASHDLYEIVLDVSSSNRLHQSFGIGQAAGNRHLKFYALYIKSFFLPSFHSSDVLKSVGFGIFACRKIIRAPQRRLHYSACSSEYDPCA